jgi:hypothetical protein
MVGSVPTVGPQHPYYSYLGFYRSTNLGASWSQGLVPCYQFPNNAIIDGISNSGGAGSTCSGPSTFSQAFYDQTLAVSPTNSSTVFFGGVGLYTSADSGNTWLFFNPSPTVGAYHSDQHALAFDPFNSAAFYAGNDGGLFYYNGNSFAR